MTAQEIRKLSNEEILEKVKNGKNELLNMRMQNARGSLEKTEFTALDNGRGRVYNSIVKN